MKIHDFDVLDERRAIRATHLMPRIASDSRTRRPLGSLTWLLVVASIALASPPSVLAADPLCSRIGGRQAFGPYDYRQRATARASELKVVEDYHFSTAHRRDAMRGKRGAWFDIEYTVRAFPNHAPALYLLGMLEHKLLTDEPVSYQKLRANPKYSPAECYFERAMRFAPDDPNVYTAHGRLLTMKKREQESIDAFKKAVELAPKTAGARYNLGLALYAAGRYEEAASAAREAYRLGYKRTELKSRLQRKGHW